MKTMSHSNDPIPGLHPAVGFVITVTMYLLSQTAGVMINIYSWSIPPILMQIGQYFAWSCMGITALITVLNYLEIKWNPFKKKKND